MKRVHGLCEMYDWQTKYRLRSRLMMRHIIMIASGQLRYAAAVRRCPNGLGLRQLSPSIRRNL